MQGAIVMRPSFATARASVLMKTPNLRQQASRRRLALICAVLALALVSGIVGSLTRSRPELSGAVETGPFSYFPSK
jgi:hypothetical protein